MFLVEKDLTLGKICSWLWKFSQSDLLSLIMFTGFKKCKVFIISENVKKLLEFHNFRMPGIRSKLTINSFPPPISVELHFILSAAFPLKALAGVLIDLKHWWERQTLNLWIWLNWMLQKSNNNMPWEQTVNRGDLPEVVILNLKCESWVELI